MALVAIGAVFGPQVAGGQTDRPRKLELFAPRELAGARYVFAPGSVRIAIGRGGQALINHGVWQLMLCDSSLAIRWDVDLAKPIGVSSVTAVGWRGPTPWVSDEVASEVVELDLSGSAARTIEVPQVIRGNEVRPRLGTFFRFRVFGVADSGFVGLPHRPVTMPATAAAPNPPMVLIDGSGVIRQVILAEPLMARRGYAGHVVDPSDGDVVLWHAEAKGKSVRVGFSVIGPSGHVRWSGADSGHTVASANAAVLRNVYPPVLSVTPSRNGAVWISMRESIAAQRITGFSPSGAVIGHALLPVRSEVLAADDGALWVLEERSPGGMVLVRYRYRLVPKK